MAWGSSSKATAKEQPSLETDESVQTAGQLLTIMVFCKQTADALNACQDAGGQCEQQQKAFATCAANHFQQAVATLVQLAGKHCPAEVGSFTQCKAGKKSAACEAEELAAMRCAAQVVIRTAAEESAATKGGALSQQR